jgi:ADP-ribosylglycohydrolase
MSKFEQFIKENRSQLDTEHLETAVWENLEKVFRAKKRHTQLIQTGIAAALILLMAIFWLLKDDRKQISAPVNMIFSENQNELQLKEENFIHLINSNIKQIERTEIPAEKTPMFDNFIEQLRTIDKQLQLIQQQIETAGYTEELIQQTIYMYQLKLSVLDMMQFEAEKMNERLNTHSHEKKKIQIIY